MEDSKKSTPTMIPLSNIEVPQGKCQQNLSEINIPFGQVAKENLNLVTQSNDSQSPICSFSLPHPEAAYCSAYISQPRYQLSNGFQEQGMIQILRQIHSEYNLSFNFIDIIGKLNLFSTCQLDKYIFSPIISSTNGISEYLFKKGRFAKCCRMLSQSIMNYGLILNSLLITNIIVMFYFYVGYFNEYKEIDPSYRVFKRKTIPPSQMMFPFIAQTIMWIMELVLTLVAFFFCNRICIQITKLTSFANLIFTLVVTCLIGFGSYETNIPDDLVYVRLAIQIVLLVSASFVVLFVIIIQNQINKFLILLKQIDETHFQTGFFV